MIFWHLIIIVTAICSSGGVRLSDFDLSDDEQDDAIPGEPLNPDDCDFDGETEQFYSTEDDEIPLADLLNDIIEDSYQARNAMRDPSMRWPDGIIPYEVDSNFNKNQRSLLCQAMSEYHQSTCIRFKPRTTEENYLFISSTERKTCSSELGYGRRGRQYTFLHSLCFVGTGTLTHELMHVAGFDHEQNRPDRDLYVKINFKNIKKGYKRNFEVCEWSMCQTLNAPYDFESILHYPRYAFAIDIDVPTIEPLVPGDYYMGQREGMTEIDILKLNRLYPCLGEGKLTALALELHLKCRDVHCKCSEFKKRGACKDKNKNWMAINCRQSCGLCDGDCVDIHPKCSIWATNGECDYISAYMILVCPKSCNACDAPIVNIGSNCCELASVGGCVLLQKFMDVYCRRSCSRKTSCEQDMCDSGDDTDGLEDSTEDSRKKRKKTDKPNTSPNNGESATDRKQILSTIRELLQFTARLIT